MQYPAYENDTFDQRQYPINESVQMEEMNMELFDSSKVADSAQKTLTGFNSTVTGTLPN